MREFETTFAKGLKKGLREDDENPCNEEALVECLNAKPSEEGLIPIVPITTPMDVSMAWPFPQVFDRPIAAAICDGITDVGYSGDDPTVVAASSTTEMTITNGLPPFTWAVTGTGLSWTYETTRGRTNSLIAASNATGEGSWTVTDRCTKETGGDTRICPASLGYSGDDPIELTADSSTVVTITLGLPPFTWAVSGTGFSWENATTQGRVNTLISAATIGCTGSWTATDTCEDEVGGDIEASYDAIGLDSENPETIARGDPEDITITDGLGPFSWAVTGTGFSFANASTAGRTNVLEADGTACGTATITVTDACDGTVIGYVRCTTGQWVEKSTDVCVLSGAGTDLGAGDYELISGNKKQTQTTVCFQTINYGGPCLGDCAGACEAYGGACVECIGSGNVPCEDAPTELLPDRIYCCSAISLAYYEWEC